MLSLHHLHKKSRPHPEFYYKNCLTEDIVRNRLKRLLHHTLFIPVHKSSFDFCVFPSRVILCLLSPPSHTARSFTGFCLLPREPNCAAHPTLLFYGEKFSPAQLLAPNVDTLHILLCLGRHNKIPLTGWLTLQNYFLTVLKAGESKTKRPVSLVSG